MTVPADALRVHFLNVGDGDNIIIEFPEVNGKRKYGIVDCYNSTKTLDYLEKLGNVNELQFICATHPHYDHICGIPKLLKTYKGRIEEFWDSGFRHTSATHEAIIDLINQDPEIEFHRASSGMEKIINNVKVCFLAPSIYLRNRYDTYGVDINNASIVLKLEYQSKDADDPFVMILGGDAQFLSWSKILEEYPNYIKTKNPNQHIKYQRTFNPLKCKVLKVAHHGSKHGTSLEYIETLDPATAIVSCSGSSSYGFPHEIALLSLKEKVNDIRFTDYSSSGNPLSGSMVVLSQGSPSYTKYPLHDTRKQMVTPP